MGRARSWTPEMLAWLDSHYGRSDVHEVTRELNATFGCDKTEQAVYVKANQRGIHRPRDSDRRRRADRTVRWSSEPEMAAFLAENDVGSIPAAIDKFEARFGFRLTPQQVSAFRTWAGRQSKAGRTRAQDWHRRPIGYERDTGKGYVLVKVREDPERPGSKDNWEMKHVLVWERSRGLRLPDGWVVLFCDHDTTNLDPGNLKAVPRSLVGVLNGGDVEWWDRESLETAVKLAWLRRAVEGARRRPRRCGCCGEEFEPRFSSQVTCDACLAKGLRAPRDFGWATCPECGERFHRNSASQKYCCREHTLAAQSERRRRDRRPR